EQFAILPDFTEPERRPPPGGFDADDGAGATGRRFRRDGGRWRVLDGVHGSPYDEATRGWEISARCPITRAGAPHAIAPSGMSRVTTAPAPITAPFPMRTPSNTITPTPNQA